MNSQTKISTRKLYIAFIKNKDTKIHAALKTELKIVNSMKNRMKNVIIIPKRGQI